jgi:hypothetical protein
MIADVCNRPFLVVLGPKASKAQSLASLMAAEFPRFLQFDEGKMKIVAGCDYLYTNHEV